MLNIEIKTVPDRLQRYNTVGDYYETDGKLIIKISEMGDWRYEFLTAVHELVESALCKQRGISEERIDAFDLVYSSERGEGDVSEPGNDERAPYFKEHQFATDIERRLANELEVNWEKYSKKSDLLNAQ